MKIRNLPVSKITRPASSHPFLRKRLFKLMEREHKHPVLWVTAPAGSGKTTLVSSFIESRAIPCLWYKADSGDVDVATFFYYLGLAAKKAAPGRKKPLPLLTPEYLPDLPTFTTRYFEDLYGRLKPGCCMVFDNYQEISEDAALHEVIRNGLEIIPEDITVIFISRKAPPPAFARIRANQSIKFIHWNDLQLTIEEFKNIIKLKLKGKLSLSKEAVAELHRITKGWAAGLVLLMERIQEGGVNFKHFKTASLDTLFNYFASELFNHLDSDTQNFLLKTSILPEMTAILAGQLSGYKNAEEVLSNLYNQNLFLEKLFQTVPVYIFHPLFREFLLSKARVSFSNEDFCRLQITAAKLLDEQGKQEDAFTLFRDSSDWEGISRLVLKHAQPLIMQGRNRILADWITSMPAEIINNTPWLLYWLGVCRICFNPAESLTHLERALQLFDEQKDVIGLFLAWSGIVETIILAFDNFTPLEHWIETLYLFIDKYKTIPSREIEDRVTANMFGALVYQMPHHQDISLWERRAWKVMQSSADNTLRILTGNNLIQYHMWIGNRTITVKLYDEIESRIHSPGVSPMMQIWWCIHKAIFGWLMGSFEDCMDRVSQGLKMTASYGIHIHDHLVLADGVYGCYNMGDYKGASDYLKKMAGLVPQMPPLTKTHYLFLSAIVASAKGDYDYAIEQANAALEIVAEAGLPFARALNNVVLANACIETGKYKEAEACLVIAGNIGHSMQSRNLEYMYLITNAYMALKLGNKEGCRELVRKAMTIARENGIVNIFYTSRPAMAGLFAVALEEGIETEHVKEIIRRYKLIPDVSIQHNENWPWPVKVYTLGRFGIVKAGKPLVFSKKAQQRPVDLLKAIIALGSRNVSAEDIIDALWPDADGDAGHNALEANISRLRKLLGSETAIVLSGRRLTINPQFCWVDLIAFKQLMGNVNACKSSYTEDVIQLFDKALSRYQGDFLAGDNDKPWAMPARENLRNQVLEHLCAIGAHFERTGQFDKAINYYHKGLQVDNIFETFYQRLMVCYQKLGNRGKAISIYKNLSKTLSDTFDIEPSQKTRSIYQSILSE